MSKELRTRSKFRGCLLGVALGDALGARIEGMAAPTSSMVEALLRDDTPLRYTDDTHMTIGIAESLLANAGRFAGDDMAHVLERNFRAQPWRGYGSGPPLVFAKLNEGVPWNEAGKHLFEGAGSFGNGSAMRVAPVALVNVGDLAGTVEMARETSRITHTHKLALQGAALQACAIGLLLQHPPDQAIDSDRFLEQVTEAAGAPEYSQKIQQIRILLRSSNAAEVVSRLGNGIEAISSVPTALFCFLQNPLSFEKVVQQALDLGGDTDTIGSMAGALSGAYLGEESIPLRWKDRLEEVDRLVDLADSLFSLAQPRTAGL